MVYDERANVGRAALHAPVCERFEGLLHETRVVEPLPASGPYQDGLVMVKAGLLRGSHFGVLVVEPMTKRWLGDHDMRRVNVEYCANVARMLAMRDHDRLAWLTLAVLVLGEVEPWERSLSPWLLGAVEGAKPIADASHDYRLEANAFVHNTYRNGPVEDLHAGSYIRRMGKRVLRKDLNRVLLSAARSAGGYLASRDRDPRWGELGALVGKSTGWVRDRCTCSDEDDFGYVNGALSEEDRNGIVALGRAMGMIPIDED